MLWCGGWGHLSVVVCGVGTFKCCGVGGWGHLSVVVCGVGTFKCCGVWGGDPWAMSAVYHSP